LPKDPVIRALVIFLIGLQVLLLGLAGWLYSQPGGRMAGGSFDSSSVGAESALGIDYSLTSHEGKTVSRSDFEGSFRLYYFGYTFCPDVCPTSLAVVGRALDRLVREDPEAAARIQPIFITVDPARDTVEVLADYVVHFHPRMIGLTGSEAEIAEVTKGFRVFAQKGEELEGGGYLMDHTSAFILMDPQGRFLRLITHGTPADEIAAALAKIAG